MIDYFYPFAVPFSKKGEPYSPEKSDQYLEENPYFISQEDEGKYEGLGVNELYDNIIAAGKLENTYKVVVAIGFGRGSCQFVMINDKK